MYVVAGVTGNTGSVVANTLLGKGKKVRVVVRDAAKGAAWASKGAEVAVASVDDAASLRKALAGATGVYGLIPPDLTAVDPFARAQKIVDAWVQALDGSGAQQVVFLSSIGAQHAAGTGPIRTVHGAEQRLRAQSVPVTFVRAAYFLENWASGLGAAKAQGILPSFEALDRAFPQVATLDIGRVAADALLEPSGSHRHIELAGAKDLSPRDVAGIVGRILGREVQPVLVPRDQIAPTLTGFGISPATAELFREMAQGIDEGHVAFEGSKIVRGTTDPEAVLRALAG